jgi:hypothetical protein
MVSVNITATVALERALELFDLLGRWILKPLWDRSGYGYSQKARQ